MIANTTGGHPNGGEGADRRNSSEEFELQNSRVIIEKGPALIARIVRPEGVEWGVLASSTVEALREVSD